MCYVVTVEKIQLVPVGEGMAAHIHEGVCHSNGPVVAALAGPDGAIRGQLTNLSHDHGDEGIMGWPLVIQSGLERSIF